MVGLALASVIFRRKLGALREMISFTFLGMMVCFLLLMFAELFVSEQDMEYSYAEIGAIKMDHKLITAVSIVIFMYNMQSLVFPAYLELRDRSNERFAQASASSVTIEAIFFIFIGFFGLILLGPAPIKADFLKNIAERPGKVSFFIRFLFCLLIMLDMPFMYMATKEQGLVIHDEIVNNSLSKRTQLIMKQKDKNED